MPELVRYARGYTRIKTGSLLSLGAVGDNQIEYVSVGVDPDVALLTKYFMSVQSKAETWAFEREVIATASRLFSNNFMDWVALQATYNEHCTGANFEFVLDTVRFIATGERRVSIVNWKGLLEDYPISSKVGIGRSRFNEAMDIVKNDDDLVKELSDNSIGIWISRNQGIGDLISTMDIFFGAPTKRMKVRNPSLAGSPYISI